MAKIIRIDGYVNAEVGDMDNSFLDEFIKFVESKGWLFCGGTTLVDEEEFLKKD